MASKELAIIGAGPKAAALAARVASSHALGHATPKLTIYESKNAGSHWDGLNGWSDGLQRLCNPAEKDVGFPYLYSSDEMNRMLLGRFSWQAYLIAKENYGSYVDRGRLFPMHKDWASYIDWVLNTAVQVTKDRITVRHHRIVGLQRSGPAIRLLDDRNTSLGPFDGVVLTGPGLAKRQINGSTVPDRVLDSHSYWSEKRQVLRELGKSGDPSTVAVIGAGGTAGAILADLVNRADPKTIALWSISAMGTLLPRGDGYSERRYFTDPVEWLELNEAHRDQVWQRTESSVISIQNKAVIDAAENITYIRGRAVAIKEDVNGELEVSVQYAQGKENPYKADVIVLATGFSLYDMLQKMQRDFELLPEDQIRADLDIHLSVQPYGTQARLHLPGLAHLTWGPGYATLGCLGLTATRILSAYS